MPFSIIAEDELTSHPGDLGLAVRQLRAASIHPDAEPARAAIGRFCALHPDALYRSCPSGHLTGSAIVVDPGAGTILLLHHAKLDRWLQPGGHADGDGDLAAVALREAGEETGIPGLRVVVPAIDVDVHTIPARSEVPEHRHLDVRFLVLAPAGARPAHNHEALGARWVTRNDPAVAEGGLVRAVDRALAAVASLAMPPSHSAG